MAHRTLRDGDDTIICDQWKREYRFKIATWHGPTGLVSEAFEVKEDGSPGYEFRILSAFESDPAAAEAELIRIVKRGLNRRHLGKRDGEWQIGKRDTLRGRIAFNDDFTDTDFDRVFVIDGKRITMEQFAKMLEPFEGWDFVFKIVDSWNDT